MDMPKAGWEVLQGVYACATAHPRVAVTTAHLQDLAVVAAFGLTTKELTGQLRLLECHGLLETHAGASEGQWHLTPLGRRTMERYRDERNGEGNGRRRDPSRAPS